MTSVLCRRNSMTLLSLFDLEKNTDLFTSNHIQSVDRDYDEKTSVQSESTTSEALLEDLPNELLIIIFQFLSPYDLHRGLYNLNLRLNAMCEVQKLRLDMSESRRAFDYYCSQQQPFASQIYSLNLDDDYDRLTIFNQHIKIELFINLRMLTITQPSSKNLEEVLSKLHMLSHLSYLNIYAALIQSTEMTSTIFRIRSLKQLILYSTDSIILQFDPHHILPLTELEYFEIDDCSIATLLELLKYLGSNLKRMKICLHYENHLNGTTINPAMIDEWLSHYQAPVRLRRLDMNFYFVPLANFHLLLRLFPHLTHLRFNTLTGDTDFISPQTWQEFISANLLELTHLQFYIEIQGLLGNAVQCPPTELLDSFHSMNSRWLVDPLVMDYNPLRKPPVLELSTYPQCARIRAYSLELYGRKRYIVTTMIDVPVNIDGKITHLRITLNDDQQFATTNNQLSLYETNGSYPKVTELIIHSQMTRTSEEEEDKRSRLIISDIIKSIPDLSKITSLTLTSDSSIYPSTILVRRLLDKMPKVSWLVIPYDYLLCLLKSPLICQLLSKKIDRLMIEFKGEPPVLPDIIRILNVFSLNLRFLNFSIDIDFPANAFDSVLPLVFDKLGRKLYSFHLRLWSGTQQQPQVFDEQFKLRLTNCLTAQVQKKQEESIAMEYRIKDNELSVHFES